MTSAPYTQVGTKASGHHRMMPLLTPTPDDIDVHAMAWAIAHVNRYTGHAGQYSVAEHCVLGARAMRADGLSKRHQLAFLFHDAHEAYTGDVSMPVKRALEKVTPGAWRKFEKIHMDNMEAFIGEPIHTEMVQKYDVGMLFPETNILMGGRVGPDWPERPAMGAHSYATMWDSIHIFGWDGQTAYQEYIAEVIQLAPKHVLKGMGL